MTNISNELVSFENQEQLVNEVCSSDGNEHLPMEFYSSHENDVHAHSSNGNEQCSISDTKILITTKQSHCSHSISEQEDSDNIKNIDQVDSDEEEIEDPQNTYRSSTNESLTNQIIH